MNPVTQVITGSLQGSFQVFLGGNTHYFTWKIPMWLHGSLIGFFSWVRCRLFRGLTQVLLRFYPGCTKVLPRFHCSITLVYLDVWTWHTLTIDIYMYMTCVHNNDALLTFLPWNFLPWEGLEPTIFCFAVGRSTDWATAAWPYKTSHTLCLYIAHVWKRLFESIQRKPWWPTMPGKCPGITWVEKPTYCLLWV